LIITLSVLSAQAASLGWDRLLHTYGKFSSLPITASDASSSGWAVLNPCDPDLGIEYSMGGNSPGSTLPITLFFAKAGFLSGYSVWSSHTPADAVAPFWSNSSSGGRWRINVSTRNSSQIDLCSSSSHSSEPVGDSIIINQAGNLNGGFEIPLTDSDADARGFVNGSCLPKMGTHWGWDVNGGKMQWEVSLFGPAIPMYWNGVLQTLFVNVPALELVEPIGSWEGPFPLNLMCLNFCMSDCSLQALWSTMHFFFKDPTLVHCPSRC